MSINSVRRKKNMVAAGLAALLFLSDAATEANIVIEPAYIKVQLTQNRASGSFLIKNTGDKEDRYRASAVHFIVTGEGGLRKIKADDHSLAEWIKFNPKEFVLPPKTSKMVRYSIIPRGKLKSQDHWCAIEFMPLKGAAYRSEDKSGHTYNISILSAILVPIYGVVQGTKYSGQINEARIETTAKDARLFFAVQNTGTGILRLEGTYKIENKDGRTIEESPLKNLIVFPGVTSATKVPLKAVLPPGAYRAQIALSSRDSDYTVFINKKIDYEK